MIHKDISEVEWYIKNDIVRLINEFGIKLMYIYFKNNIKNLPIKF